MDIYKKEKVYIFIAMRSILLFKFIMCIVITKGRGY